MPPSQLRLLPRRYVPNLQMTQSEASDEQHDYYTSFNQLADPELTVPLEVLMYQFCYLDNFQRFKLGKTSA